MTVESTSCHRNFEVPATPEQIAAWHDGALIQNAMPDISEDLRELLISGTCGQCFDEMFRDDEEDDSL